MFCVIANFWWSEAKSIFLHKWRQVPCVMSSIIPSLLKMWGVDSPEWEYIFIPANFLKVKCVLSWPVFAETSCDFQRFLTTFQRLPNVAENIRRCSEDGLTGCKESHFYSLPFGQAEANSSPNIISTSPRNVLMSRLISQFICNLDSSKNFTCPLGKLITEFTSPIAKPTSPGLSDTTFFARWFEHF